MHLDNPKTPEPSRVLEHIMKQKSLWPFHLVTSSCSTLAAVVSKTGRVYGNAAAALCRCVCSTHTIPGTWPTAYVKEQMRLFFSLPALAGLISFCQLVMNIFVKYLKKYKKSPKILSVLASQLTHCCDFTDYLTTGSSSCRWVVALHVSICRDGGVVSMLVSVSGRQNQKEVSPNFGSRFKS